MQVVRSSRQLSTEVLCMCVAPTYIHATRARSCCFLRGSQYVVVCTMHLRGEAGGICLYGIFCSADIPGSVVVGRCFCCCHAHERRVVAYRPSRNLGQLPSREKVASAVSVSNCKVWTPTWSVTMTFKNNINLIVLFRIMLKKPVMH